MRRRHASVLAVLALTLTAPAAALAQLAPREANPGYTFTRTPGHGKPGTVIYVEGGGCSYEGKPYQYAKVYLYFREKDGSVTNEGEGTYNIADDGSFSGDLTVPDDARPGKDILTADCYAADMVFPLGDFDFTVDDPSPSPSPSPSPRPSSSQTPTPKPRNTPSATPSATPSPSRPVPSATTPPVTASPPPPSPSHIATVEPLHDAETGHGALTAVALLLVGADLAGLARLRRRPTG